MKFRGGRGQIRSHRPQDPLFRVTYSCESEHWENVSNCFTFFFKLFLPKLLMLSVAIVTSTAGYIAKVLSSMENAHILREMPKKCSNYAKN